jgi:hypothetical protein
VFEFVRMKWRGRLWLQSRPITYVTYQRSRDIWFQHPKSQPKSFSAFFIIYVKVWHVFSIFCVHLGEKITKLSSIRHVQYSQDIILQFFFFFFYLFIIIGKLHTHPVSLEPKTSPPNPLLWEKEVPVELYLIGTLYYSFWQHQLLQNNPPRT